MDLDSIPGLKEAVADAIRQEEFAREISFLDVNLELCGVEVQQFRPRHYQLLCVAGSPIFGPGEILSEHVAQFLWIVSPEFSTDAGKAEAFGARIVEMCIEIQDAIRAIFDYINDAFMDKRAARKSSAVSNKFNGPQTCLTASLFHDIARSYGFTMQQFREMPFAAIFQCLKLIDRDECLAARVDPPPPFNRSDRVKGDFLRALNAGGLNGG